MKEGMQIVNIQNPEWGTFIVLHHEVETMWAIRGKSGTRGLSEGEFNQFWKEISVENKMTDFSHLHALEERAVNIRGRMMSAKKDAEWKSQAVQLFQTEQEIADERTFLGLEDMSTDDLYAALIEEHESDVVREITTQLNADEQATAIRTAAEALVARLELPVFTTSAQVDKEVADLKAALSRGWLAKESAVVFSSGRKYGASFIRALKERSMLDPDAPDAIVVARDGEGG